MEKTLGKRIAENRKRLGLTQDQLAEKLGITAQAVSKWENDQSCPDITVLPKLAEIFGITTDELLGRESAKAVHEAEVVQEENEPEGIHIQKGNWEFKWDNGKKDAVTFAVLVLWVGALTLLTKLMEWDASFWGILWPSVLLIYGISKISPRFSVFALGCAIFGGYSLLANLNIWKIGIAKELVFPVMIVLFGVGLLIDALKKPKKPHFTITHGGKQMTGGSEKTKSEYTTDDNRFSCSLVFGERSHLVNLETLAGGDASVSFGELHIDLTGCQKLEDGCSVSANCSFGELELLVPRRFRVESSDSTAFASISVKGSPDPDAVDILYIDSNVSFGEITIRYV